MQLTIPRLYLGKRKQKSQMCWVATDDGQCKRIELDVVIGCALHWEKGLGFVLDEANQYLGDDGNWYQVCGEKSCLPISTINPARVEDLKELLKQIFHRAQATQKQKQYEKAAKSLVLERVSWLVVITCISVVSIFGMKLLWG